MQNTTQDFKNHNGFGGRRFLTPQDYIEMACDVAEKNNLPVLLSVSYQNMIDYLYSVEPKEENLIWDYIEKKLLSS